MDGCFSYASRASGPNVVSVQFRTGSGSPDGASVGRSRRGAPAARSAQPARLPSHEAGRARAAPRPARADGRSRQNEKLVLFERLWTILVASLAIGRRAALLPMCCASSARAIRRVQQERVSYFSREGSPYFSCVLHLSLFGGDLLLTHMTCWFSMFQAHTVLQPLASSSPSALSEMLAVVSGVVVHSCLCLTSAKYNVLGNTYGVHPGSLESHPMHISRCQLRATWVLCCLLIRRVFSSRCSVCGQIALHRMLWFTCR